MAQTYLTYQQLTPDQQALYGNESAYNQAVSTAQSTEASKNAPATNPAVSPAVPGSRTGQLQSAGIGTSGSADPSDYIQASTGIQYAQPTLPDGTKITPQLQQAQTNEMMTTPGVSTTAPTVKVAVAKSFFKIVAVIDEDPPVIIVASANAPVASFTFNKLLLESKDTKVAVIEVELESKPVKVSPSV